MWGSGGTLPEKRAPKRKSLVFLTWFPGFTKSVSAFFGRDSDRLIAPSYVVLPGNGDDMLENQHDEQFVCRYCKPMENCPFSDFRAHPGKFGEKISMKQNVFMSRKIS